MKDQRPEKRIFSYEEAAAMLPEVRRLTAAAYRAVEELGGDGPSTGGGASLQKRLEETVNGWARALLGMGLEVKGLWLVDFDNGSGYYCWRYPEDGLHYYHSYEDGFAGRMRIQ
jgi:hypothetical protein